MAAQKSFKNYGEEDDIDCPPSAGGKCKPSGNKRSGTYKSEEYKPTKTPKMSKKEEVAAQMKLDALTPYQRDFPGDISPSGFGPNSGGKKSTLWRNTEKGIRYMGQSFGKAPAYQEKPITRSEKRFEKKQEKKGVGLDMTTRTMPEKKKESEYRIPEHLKGMVIKKISEKKSKKK